MQSCNKYKNVENSKFWRYNRIIKTSTKQKLKLKIYKSTKTELKRELEQN